MRNSFRKFVETPAETLTKICQSMNYLLISWNMWTGSCTNLVWRCPILMIACIKILSLNHFVLWDKFNHFNNVLVEFQQGFWAIRYLGIGALGCYDYWQEYVLKGELLHYQKYSSSKLWFAYKLEFSKLLLLHHTLLKLHQNC